MMDEYMRNDKALVGLVLSSGRFLAVHVREKKLFFFFYFLILVMTIPTGGCEIRLFSSDAELKLTRHSGTCIESQSGPVFDM